MYITSADGASCDILFQKLEQMNVAVTLNLFWQTQRIKYNIGKLQKMMIFLRM